MGVSNVEEKKDNNGDTQWSAGELLLCPLSPVVDPCLLSGYKQTSGITAQTLAGDLHAPLYWYYRLLPFDADAKSFDVAWFR